MLASSKKMRQYCEYSHYHYKTIIIIIIMLKIMFPSRTVSWHEKLFKFFLYIKIN
jgi:hypothetical protein